MVLLMSLFLPFTRIAADYHLLFSSETWGFYRRCTFLPPEIPGVPIRPETSRLSPPYQVPFRSGKSVLFSEQASFPCQKPLLFLGERIPQHVVVVLSTTATMKQITGLIRATVKYHTAATKPELLSSSSILLLPPPTVSTNSNTFSCLCEEIHNTSYSQTVLTKNTLEKFPTVNALHRKLGSDSSKQKSQSWVDNLSLASTIWTPQSTPRQHESISARSLLCSLHTMSNRAASRGRWEATSLGATDRKNSKLVSMSESDFRKEGVR